MFNIILENIYFCPNPIWQVLIVLIGSVGERRKMYEEEVFEGYLGKFLQGSVFTHLF